MSHQLKTKLKKRFIDGEYAHGYMQSHVISRIGAQIQTIRKQRNWTQSELSQRSHISQEKISLYENADFSSLTLKTLFKLAKAFDVHLNIGFTEFSKGIEDVAEFSVAHLQVNARENDLETYYPEITNVINLHVQTALEVAYDLANGNYKNCYISLASNRPKTHWVEQNVRSITQQSTPTSFTYAMPIMDTTRI